MNGQLKPVIIFLDLDGVLSSVRNLVIKEEFDPIAIRLLAMLLGKFTDQLNIQFVLHSSRRILKEYDTKEKVELLLNQHLTGHDFKFVFHTDHRVQTVKYKRLDEIQDQHIPTVSESITKTYTVYFDKVIDAQGNITDQLKSHFKHFRGWFIFDWLLRNEYKGDYCVIDDSFDLFPLSAEHVIHIKHGESICGFNLDAYDALERKLNHILGVSR